MTEDNISYYPVSSRLSSLEVLRGKVISGVQPSAEDMYKAFPDPDRLTLSILRIKVTEAFDECCTSAMDLFEFLLQGWRATHMWGPGDDNTWRVNLTKYAKEPMYAGGQSDLFSRAMLIAVLNAHIKEVESK
ncbi:hypothetical protein [Sulfitobacter sp. R18_1]|uniref:hypothetical protein n=1 Tax=Sulfitobacter sp. R18_1 TaxID=2821104 RepID=UPI001ADB8AFD|nr:hypothetical protein [Sulfitobacter sp. R18_1]MBO9428054.1 hypothetical protein [Sulfitobacter sp. R18_1]